MNKIRLLIADDHATVREALRLLVDSQPDMECVGEANDGNSAVERSAELLPDLVMMDISMPGMNGLKATALIKQRHPEIKILMLTRHKEAGYLKELISAGASGYVLKQSSSSEMLSAVRAIADGNNYIDQTLTGRVMDDYVGRPRSVQHGSLPPGKKLSEREEDILRLTAWGYANKEIAALLSISVKTVDVHKAKAQKKLDLKGRVDIIRYALLRGWLKET